MIKITKDGSMYLTRPIYQVPFPILHEKQIKIYKTSDCPKCAMLAAAMPTKFETVDMRTPEALTELRIHGIFALSAPILQVDEEFFTVDYLFTGERLNEEKLKEILGRL